MRRRISAALAAPVLATTFYACGPDKPIEPPKPVIEPHSRVNAPVRLLDAGGVPTSIAIHTISSQSGKPEAAHVVVLDLDSETPQAGTTGFEDTSAAIFEVLSGPVLVFAFAPGFKPAARLVHAHPLFEAVTHDIIIRPSTGERALGFLLGRLEDNSPGEQERSLILEGPFGEDGKPIGPSREINYDPDSGYYFQPLSPGRYSLQPKGGVVGYEPVEFDISENQVRPVRFMIDAKHRIPDRTRPVGARLPIDFSGDFAFREKGHKFERASAPALKALAASVKNHLGKRCIEIAMCSNQVPLDPITQKLLATQADTIGKYLSKVGVKSNRYKAIARSVDEDLGWRTPLYPPGLEPADWVEFRLIPCR